MRIFENPAKTRPKIPKSARVIPLMDTSPTAITRHVTQGPRGIAGRRVRESTHALHNPGGSVSSFGNFHFPSKSRFFLKIQKILDFAWFFKISAIFGGLRRPGSARAVQCPYLQRESRVGQNTRERLRQHSPRV